MKVKLLIAAVLVLSLFNNAHAQTEQQPATVANRLLRVNFLSFDYEQRIGNLSTLNFDPGFSFSFWYDSRMGGFNSRLYPTLEIQARRYYNLAKRMEKGKNIANNSGNFVALSISGGTASIIAHESPVNEASYGIAALWGIQRSYKDLINLSLVAGPGYGKNSDGRKGFSPSLGLKMGFLIYRR
jgi:hypothetical protein